MFDPSRRRLEGPVCPVCVDRFLYVVEVKALLAVPPEGTADRPPAAVIYSLRTSSVARPLDSARHLSYDRLFS